MRDAGSILTRGLITLLVLGLVAMGCSGGAAAQRQDKADRLAKLVKVDVKDAQDSTTVIVVVDRPVTFTTVRLPDPPKVIIDLAGVDVGGQTATIDVKKGPVSYITPSKVPDAKRVARLEIGLTTAANSRIIQDGGTLNILFEKKKEEAKKEEAKAEPVKPAEAPPSAPDSGEVKDLTEAKPQAAKAEPPKPAPAPSLPEARTVSGIKCAKGGDGYQVVISGDGRFANPKVFMVGKDRLVVDLPGVGSPKEKETVEVGGDCLKKVRMARHMGAENKVRVVLDVAGETKYDVKDEGKTLVVSVAPAGKKTALKPEPKAAPEAVVAETVPAKAEAAPPAKGGVITVDQKTKKPGEGINVYISKADGKAVLSSAPLQDEAGLTKVEDKTSEYVETETKIYTGGKISFDIQDADLDKVIKLLADVAGLNLIMDPADVRGKVTLKLDNVPWDQALEILLRIYNLDKVIEGNVLRVAPKAKLDDERRRELLQVAEQKKLEQQAEDLYTKTFKINFTAASDMEPQIKKILSPRGDATANPRTNELIVTDIRENLKKAEQLIGILDKEVNQIMIEARIVTVDVGYSRSLGVSWGLTRNVEGSRSQPNMAFSGGRSPLSSTVTPGTGADPDQFKVNLPAELAAAAGGVLGGFSWGHVLKDINLSLTIEALETVSKAETLSAPKILTLENQAASITSGTTLYVQTTSAAGTRPEPLNANLSLTVTPRVTGNNFIMMDVTATDNSPATPPPGSTAAIDTKSVTTKVMVKDGETIVLGGIYTKTNDKTESRVPLLGRLPLIGWLFKNKKYEEPQKELLIFITPKLVRQASRQL